jgi:hypothetical protein
MINNDEFIFYTEKELKYNDYKVEMMGRSPFDNPKLVLSRKIYPEEALSSNYRGRRHEEKVLDITRILDAYFILKESFTFKTKIRRDGPPPSTLLALYIGSSFYDCMSGGCPKWEVSILRYLCQREGIDKTEWVYPKGVPEEAGWNNIQDFLDETDKMNVPDFGEFLKKLRYKLPNILMLE